MTKMGIVYISAKIDNRKSYIGQTIKDLGHRMRAHKTKANRGEGNHFHNAIRKYGWDNFEWRIVYENVPIEQLNNMERWTIANYDTYKNGYNSTEGGEDNPMNNPETRKKHNSITQSDEFRTKMAKINSGENNPNFGKHPSQEILNKMSGENHHMYGKHHSDEHNQMMREKMSGKNHPNYGKITPEKTKLKISIAIAKNTYVITTPIGKIETIKNLTKYCNDNNLERSSMSRMANGKQKQYKGYKIKRVY